MSSKIKSKIKVEQTSKAVFESEHDTDKDDSDEERSAIRDELSAMSFEDLIKLKEKLGSKVYNATVLGEKDHTTKLVKKDYKRENKNRPREMSSKRPVAFLGNVKSKVSDEATRIRDPRFDPKCGEFNANKFNENFGFVADIKEKELVELKQQLRQSSDHKEIKRLKYLIQRMENQNVEAKKRKNREEVMNEERQSIKKAKMEMKMPRYSSNRERKARELVKQYTELKESGKLNKHLEKRRKKNVVKDRKKIGFD